MSSERRILLVMIFMVLFNGSEACFLSSEHQITRSTTNSSFYWECLCNLTGYIADDLIMYDNNDLPVEPFRPGTNTNVYVEKQNDDEQQSLNLIIQSITKTTSGTYKCVAQVDGKIHTHSYTIDAYEPLYFYQTPDDQHLVKGRTSWITCQPKSETGVMIKWQKQTEKDEQFEISDNEKYSIDYENNRLVIFNVTENDAGTYKCTARVVVTNEEADKNIEVKVMTEPEIIRVKASPDDNNPITVVAGSNLTIECVAEGMPHPEYLWNKTWEVGTPKPNVSWHQEINTIIFDPIKQEDSGVYTCYAFNPAGTSARNITVAVLSPPVITNFTDITAIEGSTVEVFCNATGTPTPNITITFEGDLNEDLNEKADFEHLPNNHYMFIELSKQGIYVCNASNEVDSVQKQMYLTVLHRPYFDMLEEKVWGWEGKTINLNCDQDSNPRAIVSWRFEGNKMPVDEDLKINKKLLSTLNNMPEPYFTLTIDNETAYGIYECTARNPLGKATKLIKLIEGFRPGNVKNISSEDPTATSVTFHMEGPDHVDGPDVIGFTASFDEENNYNITDIHKNRTWEIVRPFKLDKLKPNTTYWVRFAAVNEIGPGPWSNFYNFTTLDKSVPEPPVWNEEPIILAGNSPVLKWKAPDDNGEPIDYYTLKYCSEEEDESCITKRISPSTEIELDLESNTTYFLELVAHNAEGDSVPANVSVNVPVSLLDLPTTQLSGGAIIGISIVIVLLCLLLLDVFLLVWRRQGIIATCCCYKKDSNRKESPLNSSIAQTDGTTKLPLLQCSATATYSDKKGLLTSGETEERAASVRNNGHKEFEYNKSTGVVTGKHSAV